MVKVFMMMMIALLAKKGNVNECIGGEIDSTGERRDIYICSGWRF